MLATLWLEIGAVSFFLFLNKHGSTFRSRLKCLVLELRVGPSKAIWILPAFVVSALGGPVSSVIGWIFYSRSLAKEQEVFHKADEDEDLAGHCGLFRHHKHRHRPHTHK